MDQPPEHYATADCQALDRIAGWLQQPGRTQTALARAAGLSTGTVSRILNGTWPSAPTAHLEGMLAAVERDLDRRADPPDVPFVATSVSETLDRIVRRAHQDRDFGVFFGRVGIGKTMALAHHAATHPRVSVLVEAYPGAGAPVVMRRLVEMLAPGVRRRTVADMTAAVIDALRGSDRVLLVDEAETLTGQALLHLRRVSDVAGVGVVLIGTPELLTLVFDPDGKFGQITSRIGFWPPVVERITEEDARAIAESYLAAAGEGRELGSDVHEALWGACEGSARALRNVLRASVRYARRHSQPLTAEMVRSVERSAMGGRRIGGRAAT